MSASTNVNTEEPRSPDYFLSNVRQNFDCIKSGGSEHLLRPQSEVLNRRLDALFSEMEKAFHTFDYGDDAIELLIRILLRLRNLKEFSEIVFGPRHIEELKLTIGNIERNLLKGIL